MDRTPSSSKPTLSQQILRTFRSRSSATAPSLSASSATASPLPNSVDHSFALGLSASSAAAHDAGSITQDFPYAQPDSAPLPSSASLGAHAAELRKPIPLSQPRRDEVTADHEARLRSILAAVRNAADRDASRADADAGVRQSLDKPRRSEDTMAAGATTTNLKLGEVFRLCIFLLGEARELPLALRIGVCDLVAATVRLSDSRAAAGPKAISETRSGAPGSQSSKTVDGDHALANIDRALLCHLICDLSAGFETAFPSRDDLVVTSLPALPSQLRALEVLTHEGRDVVAFPGLVELLGDWAATVWEELQTLRRIARTEAADSSAHPDAPAESPPTGAFSRAALTEQLSLREWNMQATLHLATSIFKFSFARIDLSYVEHLYARFDSLFPRPIVRPATTVPPATTSSANLTPALRATTVGSSERRSKSKDARALTEGYDYYGLETLSPDTGSGSQSPSPNVTPHGAQTPRMTPRVGPSDASVATPAPMLLSTLPPSAGVVVSSDGSAIVEPRSELHDIDVRALLKLFDATLRYGYMPPSCVDVVTRVLCGILGYKAATAGPASESTSDDWQGIAAPVIANLLRSHCANAALRGVRSLLIPPFEDGEQAKQSLGQRISDARGRPEDVAVLVGAISFLRNAMIVVAQMSAHTGGAAKDAAGGVGASAKIEDALAPSISLPLILPALRGALLRQIDLLDLEVLKLVADLLPLRPKRGTAAEETEAQELLLAEGLTYSDWESLLELTYVARRHTEGGKLKQNVTKIFDDAKAASAKATAATATASTPVLAMLHTVSRLHLAPPSLSSSSTEEEGPKSTQAALPWTPKLAALLLSLAPMLPDGIVVDLVQYFAVHHLCLPCDPDWISNIRSLLQAFFHRHEQAARDFGTLPAPKARRKLVNLVFEQVYEAVQDLPEHRSKLILEVIVPLAQASLASEADPEVESTIRRVLVEAAVLAGSQPPDVQLRETSPDAPADSPSAPEAAQGENERLAAVVPSQGERIFSEIRQLFIKLALQSETSSTATGSTLATGSFHVSFADPPGSHDRASSRELSAAAAPSAQTHSRQGSASGMAAASGASTAVPAPHALKPMRAVLDLIAMFNRMAFTSSWVMAPAAVGATAIETRRAWSKQTRASCLIIFRDLLKLLHPPVSSKRDSSTGGGATSSRARLAILQWLVRLRTDRQHRVYVTSDLDELVEPAATALLRGPGSANATPAAAGAEKPAATDRSRHTRPTTRPDARDGRDGRELMRGTFSGAGDRSMSRARDPSRDRGRLADRNAEGGRGAGDRERSGSRSRAGTSTSTARKPHVLSENHEALWRLPQEVLFEMPDTSLRSDVVYTYIHPEADPHCAHGHDHGTIADGDENPVPLPVSEYLELLTHLIAVESDWELVSYLACHLPHQLANKHLFCGPKARDQIMALRKLLCSSILQHTLMPEVILPEEVKKTDLYAVMYATLTILISYRTLFSRSQQDEMVEAFIAGLNKSQNTAQPCVRAISVACYELQKSVTRMLPAMLVKLSTVMSSTAMSVHILELIASIAHIPACYANFTEGDYRRIFGISLQYLQYHSQQQVQQQAAQQQQQQLAVGGNNNSSSSSSRDDPRASPASFTLSQYVMMLAYYNISLWFISLRISDRPKHVPYLARGLLLANEGRDRLSDQTEVCFDFLARFTHSNAEPKPQRSFLNSIVMGAAPARAGSLAPKDPNRVSKSWLFGKALVTVTSLKKQGWVEIMVRRASGATALLCKLENAPISTLPDEDEEVQDLPAVLMMQRDPNAMTAAVQRAPELPPATIRERAEERLRVGDHLRSQRLRGSGHFGLGRRDRSASFSGAIESAPVPLSSASPDPYSINEVPSGMTAAADSDEGGSVEALKGTQIPLRESDAVREVMQEVLGNSPTSAGAQQSSSAGEAEGPSSAKPAGGAFANGPRTARDAAVDPSYIALQLSAFPDMALDKAPLLLPDEPATDRIIRAIDLTPVVDFHKIGVLYVAPGQDKELEILGNRTGSPAYTRFLAGMGDLITLKGQEDVYTGGLDRQNDEHGKYAYVWGDDISQIVYHTATLMPNHEHDPAHATKKALIGNDWVHIVFNEGGNEYRFGTIPSQFNYVNVVISPTSRGGANLGAVAPDDSSFYRVSLQCRPGLPNFSPVSDGQLVSVHALPAFVRILALNANLVSQIALATGDTMQPYTSNWVSRLQHLTRARDKAMTRRDTNSQQQQPGDAAPTVHDFTKFA